MTIRKGSCLCGAVEFEAELSECGVHVCHCRKCRKWAGGPSLSIRCESWNITNESSITWFDSSEHAQRGFCQICGSHLFFRTKDGVYLGVTAALDDSEGLFIDEHIFVDAKPHYYDFTDKSPRLTEEQFLKRIGATE